MELWLFWARAWWVQFWAPHAGRLSSPPSACGILFRARAVGGTAFLCRMAAWPIACVRNVIPLVGIGPAGAVSTCGSDAGLVGRHSWIVTRWLS
jgi:hypothetical protein